MLTGLVIFEIRLGAPLLVCDPWAQQDNQQFVFDYRHNEPFLKEQFEKRGVPMH